jgi:tetratricopeptide (TPR) repeat protein
MTRILIAAIVLGLLPAFPLSASPDAAAVAAAASSALAADPSDYRAYARRAWAAYMREGYDEAEKDYKKALHHAPPRARADLFYNLGNTYFMQQNLQAAAEAWRSGLRLRPDDADMLYNYTVARSLLEAEKKQGEKDKNSKDQQGGEGENKEGDTEKEQDDQQNQDRRQKGNESQDGKRQTERQAGEMSEEEALRLLRALQEQERQVSQNEKTIIEGLRLDKDW